MGECVTGGRGAAVPAPRRSCGPRASRAFPPRAPVLSWRLVTKVWLLLGGHHLPGRRLFKAVGESPVTICPGGESRTNFGLG